MCFLRNAFSVDVAYRLGNVVLSQISEIRELEVHYTSRLNFSPHYQRIVSDAYRNLGFIKRCTDFTNPRNFKLLYCTLVRPHLEYASVIWSPNQLKYKQLIERVQHSFLRFAAYRLGQSMAVTYHDYIPIMNQLNLRSLEFRRAETGLLFLFNIINSLINCLQQSRSFRFTQTLLPEHYISSMINSDSVNRICSVANAYCANIDLFDVNIRKFRNSVHRNLQNR